MCGDPQALIWAKKIVFGAFLGSQSCLILKITVFANLKIAILGYLEAIFWGKLSKIKKYFERWHFWAFLSIFKAKKRKKRISRINASNKKIPMFEGTFRVLRGIQGVWFFANMCRITYSWNAYLTIFLLDYYFLK